MKKISKWSVVGVLIGLAWCAIFGIRYFIVWPDDSQGLLFIAVGILIACVGWLYGENLDSKNHISAMEDYLADKEKKR